MRALAAVVAAGMLALGCSLPRAVLGSGNGVDAGGVADVGTSPTDAGPTVDAVAPPDDAWTMPGTDAGGLHCMHDSDCPADVVTDDACVYADDCATTGAMNETTTHTTCDGHVCTPHVSMGSAPCSRETDGTPCGTITCGACSATACDATGTQSCNGPMCASGACTTQTTSVACSTPSDMCGSPPPWGLCHLNLSGPCTQERIWGGCGLGSCLPLTGTTESRTCTC